MSNPQKAKGSSAERAVVDYLRGQGFPHAERRLAGSSKDRGDIAGIPSVVVEVKACARTDLGAWVAEAETERANDNAQYGVVWHKRRRKSSAGDWYVTLTGEQFVTLLRQAGYGDPADPPGDVLFVDVNPDPRPDCPDELHGADGGACPTCRWDVAA